MADLIGIVYDMTERERLEDALHQREERLAFLLQLNDALRPLSDPVAIQDVTVRLLGEHLRVNRVAYSVIDGEDFIVTRSYDDGVDPFSGRHPIIAFGQALLDAYRRGEPVTASDVRTDPRFTEAERTTLLAYGIVAFVRVMLRKDGRWVAIFGVNSTTPRHWTGYEIALIEETAERMWSAAERARTEAALRERDQRLRLALEASAGGSWTRDSDANHIDWDDGFRQLYGIPFGETPTFDGWLNRVHAEDRPKVLDLVDDLLHPTRDAWDIVFRIVRSDGTVAWIQSLGRVERETGGTVTRLIGLELDVTARRQAEEALQARRDEEHNRELRLLLETATQGIVSVDAKGVVVTANRALEAMFGWAPGELLGQSVERLVPSAVRGLHVQHRSRYFAMPRPRLMAEGLELVGERKDGSRFPIEVHLNHVVTPAGGHAIAFVTDITARKRAELTLQERTAELERRTAQLRQMASDLTLTEQHAREQLARTLHDGLQQLLVSAALNVDRLSQGGGPQGVDSGDLLKEVRNHLEEAIDAARSLSFELFPPVLQTSGLPAALVWLADWTRKKYGLEVEVRADPLANSSRKDTRTLLFESVRELLLNAAKHARTDRVTVDLTLEANDMLSITVGDQGIGFDPGALIEQAKGGQMGWGLFSIRERLTLLGGRFDTESAPGRGTTFRLKAPRGDAVHVDLVHSEPPPSAMAIGSAFRDASVASLHTLSVLIVDDHSPMRKALQGLLQERRELKVVGEAANGLEAITQAHALRPDVIVMDVSMPVMDGVEATRRIRVELPTIRIVGLSMYSRTEVHDIEQAGAECLFTKSADTRRLIDHLVAMQKASLRLTQPVDG